MLKDLCLGLYYQLSIKHNWNLRFLKRYQNKPIFFVYLWNKGNRKNAFSRIKIISQICDFNNPKPHDHNSKRDCFMWTALTPSTGSVVTYIIQSSYQITTHKHPKTKWKLYQYIICVMSLFIWQLMNDVFQLFSVIITWIMMNVIEVYCFALRNSVAHRTLQRFMMGLKEIPVSATCEFYFDDGKTPESRSAAAVWSTETF